MQSNLCVAGVNVKSVGTIAGCTDTFFVLRKQGIIHAGYLGRSAAGLINSVEKSGLFLYNGENLVINKRKVLKK